MNNTPVGCLGFVSDVLGFRVVARGWRTRRGLTMAALLGFWAWAFLTGLMIVRYGHLGEHPYVFEILPIASCVSPVVAASGVVVFTIGDALTNLFSGALTHSFGIEPPINLYSIMGQPQPLLTWGAYVRLNLVGLMLYAVLPGLFGRTLSRVVSGAVRAAPGRPGRGPRIRADGPPPFDPSKARRLEGADEAGVLIGSYAGAVLGAAGGTLVGGGLYYADMWAEYHPIREMTIGSADPSCFKMDANYAADNVVSGGTMSPVGGAAAVAAGSAGAAGAAGAGPGAAPPGGPAATGPTRPVGVPPAEEAEDLPMDQSGTVIGITKEAGNQAIEAEKERIGADAFDREARETTRRHERISDADARSQRLGNLADAANILNDWSNMMEKDGMSWYEAGARSILGNLAGNAATVNPNVGLADLAAGIFLPQSIQGYSPGNVAKEGVKAGVDAVGAWSSFAGGDDEALDRFADAARRGDEGKVAEGWSHIFEEGSNLILSPGETLRGFADGVKEIWGAGPLEMAGEALDRWAADALAGKEGPFARTVAEMGQAAGRFSTDPAGVTREMASDVSTIIREGEASNLILGEEGSQRATQILGPIGQGYAEGAQLAGEVWEDPRGFASDVAMTGRYVAGEAWDKTRGAASWAWNGISGFFR